MEEINIWRIYCIYSLWKHICFQRGLVSSLLRLSNVLCFSRFFLLKGDVFLTLYLINAISTMFVSDWPCARIRIYLSNVECWSNFELVTIHFEKIKFTVLLCASQVICYCGFQSGCQSFDGRPLSHGMRGTDGKPPTEWKMNLNSILDKLQNFTDSAFKELYLLIFTFLLVIYDLPKQILILSNGANLSSVSC